MAGVGFPAFCGDGGPATQACITGPESLAFDGHGNLVVTTNYRIQRIGTAGTITTIAGNGTATSCGSGDLAPATCVSASGIAIDAAGRIYLSEAGNRRIRLVTTPS